MSAESAVTRDGRTAVDRFHLAGALVTAGLITFTTALIGFSGSHTPYWLLYLLPIVSAALAYDVAGAVVATTVAALACSIVLPSGIPRAIWTELACGAVVFLVCGVVVGVQARRRRTHATALEAASPLDAVTHVLRPEPFAMRLAEEVQRADRYRTPLGLVAVRVIDLDGFSRVFGHYKTGLMLEHLAGVLALSARAGDTIGRVAGPDFALSLPGADADGTRSMAERVRELCATTSFEGDALEPVTSCPVTVGWASYPDGEATAEALLERALERAVAPSARAPVAPDADEVPPCGE